MPYALIAGIVTAKPHVEHFPKTGNPRASVTIRCDSTVGELYRIIGFDDMVGDGRLIGISVRPMSSAAEWLIKNKDAKADDCIDVYRGRDFLDLHADRQCHAVGLCEG